MNELDRRQASHWYGDAGHFFQSVFRLFSRNAMPTLGAATLVALLVARARRSHAEPADQTPTADDPNPTATTAAK